MSKFTDDFNEQEGLPPDLSHAEANRLADEHETYIELREKNFKILSSLNAELLKANAIGLPKVFHDGGFQHGWDIGGERFYKAGHAAGAASREAQALELNELNENAIIALRKERDKLKADLAGLVEAMERIHHAVANAWEWQVADPEDSELDRDQQIGNWCEKACGEIKDALARVRGKGGYALVTLRAQREGLRSAGTTDLIELLMAFGHKLTKESGPGTVVLCMPHLQMMAIKNWFGSKYNGEFIAGGIHFYFEENGESAK